MSDTRTYIVPDGQENSTNQMLPWMAMMNGGMGGFGGNGMWNNPFMYLVWMWMMRWMNRGEWGDEDNCQKLQSANFQKLPAMGDIADFGNNIVVSCNKEAMNSEVSSMKQRSLDIINSIETHQSIIKGCDEILQQLNPEIIEKQRQEQENKALREEINSLKEMFKEFINTSLKQEKHGNNN